MHIDSTASPSLACRRRLFDLVQIVLAAASIFGTTSARADSEYNGKMIRMIVGVAVGGGYDIYGRMVARHIGRHIPGNPNIQLRKIWLLWMDLPSVPLGSGTDRQSVQRSA